ncbi:hypothetical protein PZE06_21785 [Robertmurraya sp. DFI.2.37]|uniref:hypothetical protein n=1 Tax=Robertmurraya sp. DFI.2.37 TaxID=3031819 RepID=UPI001246B8D2|nr:hypothetical protein [Robertmurraya sp. DFI.2.37]MDF1510769.1 hypothetical protein [Robertmurraya sp. DFI.2.37]
MEIPETWQLKKASSRGSKYYTDANDTIVAKICNGCGEVKLLNEYRNEKRGLGGKASKCKTCILEWRRQYRKENRDKYQEQNRRYHEQNREKILEKQAKYREENRERIRIESREYYRKNTERVLASKRKWRESNPEKQSNSVRNWEKRNPDRVKLKGHRRRARKSSLQDDFTNEQMQATLSYFGGCALTGESENVHWDHVIPLSIGTVGTTESNMIPLRQDLNQSKSNSNLFEWYERNKTRYNLSQKRFDRLIEFLAQKNEMSIKEYRSFYFSQFNESKQNIS